MTGNPPTKVCIVYPADPAGVVPGGIDTFIRGILRWAPPDIEISLVGVTTKPGVRPVGKWTVCDLGRRTYRFYPVAPFGNPAGRSKIPLSVRFSLGLVRRRPEIDADVLEFHRFEPSIVYWRDTRPRTAMVHQNMQDLSNKQSDILWSRCPRVFFWLEGRLIPRFSSIYAVREDAVTWYKERYPDLAERFSFLPTWYDPDIFSMATAEDKSDLRQDLRQEFGLPDNFTIAITVGRLDAQKDPMLLAKSFQRLTRQASNIGLIFVGDGVLRHEVESFVREAGLENFIRFAGLRSAKQIAAMLKGADLFVLPSAYEGMPMCVLEALGAGLPVVTTDVGEVRRVVRPGHNGFIIDERTPEALASAMRDAIAALARIRGEPCTSAVSAYVPEQVLAPVYENYRKLAGKDDHGD